MWSIWYSSSPRDGSHRKSGSRRRDRGNRPPCPFAAAGARLDAGGAGRPLGPQQGLIVELEQGRTNPSVATLCRLAAAFGVGLAQLLELGDEPELRIVSRDQAVRLWNGAEGGWGDFLVGSQHPAKVEFWEWTLEPRRHLRRPDRSRGQPRAALRARGEITLVLDHRHRTALPERTAALYTTDRPNRIEDNGAMPARVIMVIVEGRAADTSRAERSVVDVRRL
jgi:transcriptional regulator with XRE-family HTH domain